MLHTEQLKVLATLLATSVLLASTAAAENRDPAQVKRGALLTGIGGCADCHAPLQMGADGPRRNLNKGLSGHPETLNLPAPPPLNSEWNWAGSATTTAFVGPWGISYAANLTPDRDTGIGQWTEKDFVRAMRNGKHLGVGRPILPPMPWQALAGLPDNDLRAIYAYLMAQPAVKNKVPEYLPPPAVASTAESRKR